VLFDRDGTIVVDEPYNGDPERVVPSPRARESLDALRLHALRIGVMTNQSGVGRRMITMAQVEAVNRRVDELLGPFDGWFVCPHAPEDECECRKPKPKLVFDAAKAFGVEPAEIVVVGDREADVGAAENAGAISIKINGPGELAEAIERVIALL
jgi:histidinol-phosphate phosphatase family protein